MNLSHGFTSSRLHERRERVFLVLAGLFLGTLTILNVLGITRFIDLSFTLFGFEIPMVVAVGVLPYPITFLCTDFISEFYGKSRASAVVWMGFILNLWVVFILWLGGVLPPQPSIDPATGKMAVEASGRVFFEVKALAFGAVTASMVAFLGAQFCDVYLFHFWKKLTRGKHLWLRNNGSTLISQMIDSVSVILITHFYAYALPLDSSNPILSQLFGFILSSYIFKMTFALVDTIPMYVGSAFLKKFLQIDPRREDGDDQ